MLLKGIPQRSAVRAGSCGTKRRLVVVNTTAGQAPAANGIASKDKPFINVIPQSQWPSGVPAVMGAHLMASGIVAPISVSKGAGIDVAPHQFQYNDGETDVSIVLYATSAAASNGLAKAVTEAASNAIKAKGSFTLVLSGGSLLTSLSSLATVKGIEWDKWHIFFADERNVPHSSADSNFKGAMDAFLSKVPIPAQQIHAIVENVPVQSAAINYEGRLVGLPTTVLPRTADNFPIFDMILLGIGPDGHVASLFPNRPETAATSGWVLPVTNSPKPPPERITLTMPVINNAKDVMIVAVGESKAEIVHRVLEVQSLPGALPAQLVKPAAGKLRWVLDVMSAQNLDIAEWENKKAYPRSQF